MTKRRSGKGLPPVPSTVYQQRLASLRNRPIKGVDLWGLHRCNQCGAGDGVFIVYEAGDCWDLCLKCFAIVADQPASRR